MVNTQVFEWSSVKETTFDLKAYLSERRSQVEAALEQSITVVYPEISSRASASQTLLTGGF
jgi:geranylgeranyl diphosphate synthase, type II